MRTEWWRRSMGDGEKNGGISRRRAGKMFGLAALSPMLGRPVWAERAADYRVEIGTVNLEIGPRHAVKTTGYNGQVPGPLLRLKQGRVVTIELTNRSERPEIVHWHGLSLPPAIDGASEEGTPFLAPGETRRISFAPETAGFRWYHTHTMAGTDLSLAQYGGQHGFLMIEAGMDAARYDQEIFVGLHDWGGRLSGGDDGAMNPIYEFSTMNGKLMGAGEPLRVKQGDRVLLHVLNSSATEVHWIAMAGHRFQVVSLDGNPVGTEATVEMLRLSPAERVCAVVTMDHPGVWVMGEVRRHVQAAGMAMVVEYAGHGGAPRWEQPTALHFDYAAFSGGAASGDGSGVVTTIPLVLDSRFRGHGSMEGWTINGRSYPESGIAPLQAGRRYRLQFINRSLDDHPMHLHRHRFELRTVGTPLKGAKGAEQGRELSGVVKDTVLVDSGTMTEVEFTADNPGATLLHCHQQDHMDRGFMMVLRYA